jgi:hypothetical protein
VHELKQFQGVKLCQSIISENRVTMVVGQERLCEMGSDAMINMPSFINIGSGIKKLGGIHRQQGDLKPTFIVLLQNNECGLRE